MQPQENNRQRPKVVLLGAQGVGKTSLVNRQNGQQFTCEINPTIGAGYCLTSVETESGPCDMQVWDTAGQERFRSMAPLYYRNADGALVVYDVTSSMSLNSVKRWVTELQQFVGLQVSVVVVGNKMDLKEQGDCSEEARSYAQSIGAPHCETSALNGQGVVDAFRALAGQIRATRAQANSNNGGDSRFELSSRSSPDRSSSKQISMKSRCSC